MKNFTEKNLRSPELSMLIQPEGTPMLAAASIRPHLVIRDSSQPPE